MGVITATSIGVGAMIGAGLFALIGVAVDIAGKSAYIAFLIAGFVALLTSYSFSKLAVAFPSKGGPVEFLNRAFGSGIFSGGFNILLWIGYLIVTSLYARAFGEYGIALFNLPEDSIWINILTSSVIILFVLINFLGSSLVGKSELIIVSVKVLILLIFGIISLRSVDIEGVSLSGSFNFGDLLLASGVVFMSYEGFGLVVNTAEDIKNPKKNLPVALFLSVIIVMLLYTIVSFSVIGNLSIENIINAKEYALAEAARPVMGPIGFEVMAVAALFSTSSAINATIYGPVNMLNETARAKQLPGFITGRLFQHQSGIALIATGSIVLITSNLLDLEVIAETGSMIFLLVYTVVNTANLKLSKLTGSKGWIVWPALLGTGFSFMALFYYQVIGKSLSLYILGGIILIVFAYQWLNKKVIQSP